MESETRTMKFGGKSERLEAKIRRICSEDFEGSYTKLSRPDHRDGGQPDINQKLYMNYRIMIFCGYNETIDTSRIRGEESAKHRGEDTSSGGTRKFCLVGRTNSLARKLNT